MTVPRYPAGLVALSLLAAAAAAGCDSPETFIPLPALGGAAGVLEGALTYSGPPPCTEGGHIVGAAIVLGFDKRLLPPPEGLGSLPTSIDVISGDELFAGIRDQLPVGDGGALRCPEANAAPVTVTGTWVLSPLSSGTYQVRGFYDLDGDFDPAFLIANLPTQGDIGGGAIDNAAEVLEGKPPRYREITLGTADASGALVIPEKGARVGGIAVTLGLPLPLERPIFHVADALGPDDAMLDPNGVVMPADFRMQLFNDTDPETEKSFIRLRLNAGVPEAERIAAQASPFFLPVGNSLKISYSRQDVNGDGKRDGKDTIVDSALIPSLFPLSIFSKLPEASSLGAQSAPTIILQGITLYKSLIDTVAFPDTQRAESDVLVALRPATLCLDPAKPERGGVLVVSWETDSMGHKLISDERKPVVEAALSEQFGRKITVEYGCLPQGRYSMNLVYGTGQAWTLPNEAGVCAPSEASSAGACGQRPRLASQDVALTIGPPDDQGYCDQHPTPALCSVPTAD
jgi:hypothetical protein